MRLMMMMMMNGLQIKLRAGGGEEQPLDEKLPDNFKVKDRLGFTCDLTGGLELHRRIISGDKLDLRQDLGEALKLSLNATCTLRWKQETCRKLAGNWKEVRQEPLPLLPRSPRCE